MHKVASWMIPQDSLPIVVFPEFCSSPWVTACIYCMIESSSCNAVSEIRWATGSCDCAYPRGRQLIKTVYKDVFNDIITIPFN